MKHIQTFESFLYEGSNQDIRGMHISDATKLITKIKDIETYINFFFIDNQIKLGRDYAQKELLWNASKITDDKLQKNWMNSIKTYVGKEFIKDFDPIKYRN